MTTQNQQQKASWIENLVSAPSPSEWQALKAEHEAEMHRLQTRIAELEAQLEAIGAGGVEPLRKQGGQVLIDFDQVGTAGPFAVVDGRVHLPGETMMDLARMLKPTIDAMAAAPQAVQAINGQSLRQVREAFFKKYGREPLADDVSFAKMVVAAFSAPAHPAEGEAK